MTIAVISSSLRTVSVGGGGAMRGMILFLALRAVVGKEGFPVRVSRHAIPATDVPVDARSAPGTAAPHHSSMTRAAWRWLDAPAEHARQLAYEQRSPELERATNPGRQGVHSTLRF